MWCVKLSDSQRDALRGLIRAQGELGTSLRGALEGLDYARWDDLPDAHLPWERVAQLSIAEGIGEADVVWHLAADMPAAPKALVKQPVSRRARKTARPRG